jgi:hypothetical protein
VEGQFLADVAQRRWPVLIFIFCFDVFCYILRLGARLVANVRYGLVELAAEMGPQLANMGFCYLFLGLVNARSRRGGDIASRQVRGAAPTCMPSRQSNIALGAYCATRLPCWRACLALRNLTG